MNKFIYTEDNVLHITKPNGLRYHFENCDKPNLGFEYEVLVYADKEVKIEKWDNTKNFDEQETIPLTDSERDAIEKYIENSEPPLGVSLNNIFCEDLNQMVRDSIGQSIVNYGFDDMVDVIYAGREGSNHPFRTDARRVLEFADASWHVFQNTVNEIQKTREDHLLDFEKYATGLPQSIDPKMFNNT